MRLEYNLYDLPGWELEDLALSLGVSFLNVGKYSSLNRLIERLHSYGKSVLIDGKGKTETEIKALLSAQIGKPEIVVFDSFKNFPNTVYLESCATLIPASFIVINRIKYKR